MNNRVVAGIEIIVLTAALAGVPVAMGIAILRHRLFDIDLIIRRTLVYALLVATLTGVYLTGVVGLSAALRAIAGGTGALVVTLSTLAVASTFQPLRTRIQAGRRPPLLPREVRRRCDDRRVRRPPARPDRPGCVERRAARRRPDDGAPGPRQRLDPPARSA